MYTQIKNNCVFFYSKDIELMYAVVSVLSDMPAHEFCVQLYGDETIAALKQKYSFFCEILAALHNDFKCGILEPLMDFPIETFSLNTYKEYLLSLDKRDFIQAFLSLNDSEQVEAALFNDEGLDSFYTEHSQYFNSYLGCQSFLRHTDRFIRDFFAFANELDTESFNLAVQDAAPKVQSALDEAKCRLDEIEPLEYSQEIMGKVFKNRGPYQQFTFSPSLMLPYTALRFFGKSQMLFFTLQPAALNDDRLTEQLSAIADSTRFKIITLLKDKKPLRGTDIAKNLSLAPSTVSHHMEQLRNAGLINEEQVKNSKYYSINTNNAGALIKRLSEILI